jgi:outer membrane receptor protein involved in Fe transport
MRRTTILAALAALAAGFTLPTSLHAQDSLLQQRHGRVVGRVFDAGTGEPIAGAQVTVDGMEISVRTDVSGRYTIVNLPPGRYSITVRTIGYSAKTVTGVHVNGVPAELDVSLTSSAIQIGAIEVTADLERGSVASALDQQRSATQIVSTVSQEQIKKSPDSDAGQVMQRVSGVTVQDGRYVFVRGLGERYTTTSLNNARIPSPEPERKTVPLDLFPAGLLQSVVTSKTFTPEQPGDFSGAQVDLRTREFPAVRMVNFSSSVGFNDAATFRQVLAAPRVGAEWWGFSGAARAIPPGAQAADNLSNLNQTQVNDIVASFRDVWLPWTERAKPNGSFGAALGGEEIIAGHPLGYIASLSYSETQEIREDEERATPAYGGVPDSVLPVDYSRGSTGTLGVQWGGLLNLTGRLGGASVVSLSNTYTRSADNQATRHLAFDEEFQQVYDATRLTMIERFVRSNQLRGEHLLGERHSLNWSLTSSAVRRREPDRSDLRYQTATVNGVTVPTSWAAIQRSAVRTFADLTEDVLEGSSALGLALGAGDRPWRVKIGAAYRHTSRDADTRAFDIGNLGLTEAERTGAPEQVLSAANARDSAFYITPDAVVGRYQADDDLFAGFVQMEIPLSSRVQLIGGARVERWVLDMSTATLQGLELTARRNTDVLPALAFNIKLSEAHTLRLSASQTLARPEYREISPSGYRDFIGALDVFGNANLQRALIQNFDLRWEWYPHSGELISVGLFAKHFDKPIEKVIVGTTGGAAALRFENADAARNYGLELELRKNLVTVTPALAPFTVFANATVMHSRVDPGPFDPTEPDRPMVGQAGYVVNAGLGYTAPNGALSATVLYNVVGRRIAEAGTALLADAYEEARNLLDVSLQAPLPGGMTLKVDGKNLLDAPTLVTQGSLTRLRYTTGRVFAVGLTWQP